MLRGICNMTQSQSLPLEAWATEEQKDQPEPKQNHVGHTLQFAQGTTVRKRAGDRVDVMTTCHTCGRVIWLQFQKYSLLRLFRQFKNEKFVLKDVSRKGLIAEKAP